MTRKSLSFLGAAALSAGLMLSGPAAAQKTQLKMSTIAPGSSMYLVMTTMANLVNQNLKDVEINVDATGAATKHMVDVGREKIDMSMTSPTVYNFMAKGVAMYKKLKEAPKLAKNLRVLFWFPLGAYHYVTYADSGITKLEDIKGKRVFLGPPGGGQWNTARVFLQGVTGLKVNADYSNVKASFSAAQQSFQDRQIDVWTVACIDPCAVLQQVAATSKIRFLGTGDPNGNKHPGLSKFFVAGRTWDKIKNGIYGANQEPKADVYSNGAVLGVTARSTLSNDLVYKMMKTYWTELDKIRANAPWTETVTLDYATQKHTLPFHPGAEKFYKEIGKM